MATGVAEPANQEASARLGRRPLPWLGPVLLSAGLGILANRQLDPGQSALRIALALATPAVIPLLIGAVGFGLWHRSRPVAALALTALTLTAGTLNVHRGLIGCGPAPQVPDELTVITANVLFHNTDPDLTDDLIEPVSDLAGRADVIVITELTSGRRDQAATKLEPHFPNRFLRARDDGANGIGVYSRWPLLDEAEQRLGRSVALSATVDAPGGRLPLIAVHLTAPIAAPDAADWHLGFDQLGDQLSGSGPGAIVVGDFNASGDHAPFRALLSRHGLVDALDVKGCGPDATWPTRRLTPPLARLDHVAVPTAITEVLEAGTFPLAGSDHHAVFARLAPRSSPKPAG